jgi:hypothetical protein
MESSTYLPTEVGDVCVGIEGAAYGFLDGVHGEDATLAE